MIINKLQPHLSWVLKP